LVIGPSVCLLDQGSTMAAATALSSVWSPVEMDVGRWRSPLKGALQHTVPTGGRPSLLERLPFSARSAQPEALARPLTICTSTPKRNHVRLSEQYAMVGSPRRETATGSRPASSIFLVKIWKRGTMAYAVACLDTGCF
jgi:hypothetical protein